MWRNYLTVGLRALAKNKTYAFINIFGLAIGMAACLMILLYVRYEQSYDKWLPDAENTYQLQSHYRNTQSGEEAHLQMTSYVAGPPSGRISRRSSKTVYALSTGPVVLRNGQALATENVIVRRRPSSTCCNCRSSRAIRRRALANPGTVVLTAERGASGCSATNHAIGRTLTMVSRGITTDYRVTGIARDLPQEQPRRLRHGRADRLSPLLRRQPRLHDRLGLAIGLVLFHAQAGQRSRGDPPGAAGLGEAQHPRREVRRRALSTRATTRTGGCRAPATSISAKRRTAPTSPATTGGRSSPSRSSRC